jgi:hypothetical protein
VVVASRTASSNGVQSTWSYSYYLTAVNASIPGYETRTCNGSCESYDWGNQNDADTADYYNGDFQSFSQAQVILPDGSSQTDSYGSTNGWGIFSNNIACNNGNNSCTTAPYNSSNGPVLAGKQSMEQDYNASSALMKQLTWSWSTNCPPPGVAGSANAPGGSTSPPGGSGGFLFSWLDHNNPVMDCDPRPTQEVTALSDGGGSSVSTTTTYSYDGNTCGSKGYDYGNLTTQDVTASDVGSTHIVSSTQYCPNDNISGGIYLTDLPMQTQTQDQSGTQYGCSQITYGSNSSYNAQPTVPDVTRTANYTA